ncbi:hypothetical protein DPEC_G00028290 [Dallia pectoralis]|uniref:Uncharacterized protein n=1 Tax=Dallia pectoralis TaxID=75939 RepID=A0ACC2HI50_DALPE|nr:hypothetical protein DPEC_G00028290 [Dallia pectoralis]
MNSASVAGAVVRIVLWPGQKSVCNVLTGVKPKDFSSSSSSSSCCCSRSSQAGSALLRSQCAPHCDPGGSLPSAHPEQRVKLAQNSCTPEVPGSRASVRWLSIVHCSFRLFSAAQSRAATGSSSNDEHPQVQSLPGVSMGAQAETQGARGDLRHSLASSSCRANLAERCLLRSPWRVATKKSFYRAHQAREREEANRHQKVLSSLTASRCDSLSGSLDWPLPPQGDEQQLRTVETMPQMNTSLQRRVVTSNDHMLPLHPLLPHTLHLRDTDRQVVIGSRKSGVVTSSSPLPVSALDCLDAERGCLADHQCKELYRTLEYCVSQEVQPVSEVRIKCQEAQSDLHNYPLLLMCQCHRGSRREEHCLKVYWKVRTHQGYDDLEESPYEDVPAELSPMASIVAEASSFPLDGQNVCLKAAQDCGLFEKCGALRSEYVLACTKRLPGSDHCNRQKCHRALRRFLERVPEEYSLGVLFCPCTDRLCGERRRKTIVPSCSYQVKDGIPPNCLYLQSFCRKDTFCRSRLADFQHNCQPSQSPSGCVRETGAACLKSYAGLIGTTMTPNYVSNSSMGVALWCTCDGSGNQWHDCLRIQHMFTKNRCLENSISSMGSSTPRPAESIPPSPPPWTMMSSATMLWSRVRKKRM